MENIKIDNDEEPIGDFDVKSQISESDIEEEIPNIVHEEYEYDVYSQLDGSNDRFMRKQHNTNKLENAIASNNDEETESIIKNKDLKLDLFD
jgi:hypothetical protein